MIDIWTPVIDLEQAPTLIKLAYTCARGTRQVSLVEQLLREPVVRGTMNFKHPKTGDPLQIVVIGTARVDQRSFANLKWRLELVGYKFTFNETRQTFSMVWDP
jgi:hypothetical protein